MNNSIETHVESPPDATARLAYQLWQESGSPPGRDLEFWLRAEAQLCHRQTHNAKPTPVTLAVGASCITTHDGSMPHDPPLKPSRPSGKSSRKGTKA